MPINNLLMIKSDNAQEGKKKRKSVIISCQTNACITCILDDSESLEKNGEEWHTCSTVIENLINEWEEMSSSAHATPRKLRIFTLHLSR